MNWIMDRKIFLLLAILCTITHLIRFIYEMLKHKKIVKANKITFVIIFINMILLWVSWFLLCSYDVYKIELAGIIRYMGILLTGIGVILFFTALLTIKSLESYNGNLITKGIYSKIRHPMYLSFILWLIGFPVYFGAFISFLFSLIFIANILLWRYFEEMELVERFPSYRDYRKTTIF